MRRKTRRRPEYTTCKNCGAVERKRNSKVCSSCGRMQDRKRPRQGFDDNLDD